MCVTSQTGEARESLIELQNAEKVFHTVRGTLIRMTGVILWNSVSILIDPLRDSICSWLCSAYIFYYFPAAYLVFSSQSTQLCLFYKSYILQSFKCSRVDDGTL